MRRPSVSLATLIFLTTCSTAVAYQADTRIGSGPTPAPDRQMNEGRAHVLGQGALLEEINQGVEKLVTTVSPAVVKITTHSFSTLLNSDKSQSAMIGHQEAIGSGVVVDSNGYILTNAHVIRSANRVQVEFIGQDPTGKISDFARSLRAQVVGMDSASDLALLKVNASNLPFLPCDTGASPHQGELVFAFGSPEGLADSVTMGVVSSARRQPDPNGTMVYIQTDAAINHGNSGGPLVNIRGEFLGINTYILTQTGGSEGIGFAIPARIVNWIYHDLRRYGHVHRPSIGISVQSINDEMKKGLQLPRALGVIITDVKPGGPAEKAGAKSGDIIKSGDDLNIESIPDLSTALYTHGPSQQFKLTVLRGGSELSLLVSPEEEADQVDELSDMPVSAQNIIHRLGIIGVDIDSTSKTKIGNLRIPTGVLVIGRTASEIDPNLDFEPGDVIHSINLVEIRSVAALKDTLRAMHSGDPVAIRIERNGEFQFLTFELE